MEDKMPDFELPTPEGELPIPPKKKPRKPVKRAKRKAEPVDRGAAIRFGKAKAKKRRKIAKRRGRPAGSLNKPKVVVAAVQTHRTDVVAFIENVLAVTSQPWQARILRQMVKEV
jgi:hypothetical protein